MSHSGNNDEVQRQLAEFNARLFGEYPDGRLNEDDQGAIPVAIGVQNERVVMQFPKSVSFIGFTADQAMDIAQSLVEHARKCGSKKPLTFAVG